MVGTKLPYHDELVEHLRDDIGDHLRVVDAIGATDDGSEYEHVYIRDDVDDVYPEERQERVLQEFVYHLIQRGSPAVYRGRR